MSRVYEDICDLCGHALAGKPHRRYKIKREWYLRCEHGWERIDAHDECVQRLLNASRRTSEVDEQ